MSAKKGNNDGGTSPRERVAEAEPSLADRLLTEKRLAAERATLIRFAMKWIAALLAIYAGYLVLQFWIKPSLPKVYLWAAYVVLFIFGALALHAANGELKEGPVTRSTGDEHEHSGEASQTGSVAARLLELPFILAAVAVWFVLSIIAGFFLHSLEVPALPGFVSLIVTFLAAIALMYWGLPWALRHEAKRATAETRKIKT